VFGDPMVDFEKLTSMLGAADRNRWKTRVAGALEVMNTAPVACLPDEITTPGEGRLHALIAMSCNFAASAPNIAAMDTALDELDLMVSLDPYITETSRHADWILPP